MALPLPAAVWLSWSGDWELLGLSVRSVPKAWEKFVIVEPKDRELTPPPGVRLIVADFPRGRNLNKVGTVVGILREFARLTAGGRPLVKVDSDCLLYRPDFYEAENDLAGVAQRAGLPYAWGCGYRISARAVQAIDPLAVAFARTTTRAPEDQVITLAASRIAEARVDLRPSRSAFWERWDGRTPNFSSQIMGHYAARKNIGSNRTLALDPMRRDLAALGKF